ncbi:hypothetical protein Bbelb_210980 [Branchiostoma belcheri]|nr:hypothetical protein Bbelb_210980 [Branchiostoma belcheri]
MESATGISCSQVDAVKLLKTPSSEVMAFSPTQGISETKLVKFKTGDHQMSVLNDVMDESTGRLSQAESLPNFVIGEEGSQHAVVAIRISTTIIDDDVPVKKVGVWRRMWKTLKKSLVVPACFRLCRPRRH